MFFTATTTASIETNYYYSFYKHHHAMEKLPSQIERVNEPDIDILTRDLFDFNAV